MSEEFEIEEELEVEEDLDIDVDDNVDEQITEEDEVHSEEDLDEVADTAIEVLRTILAHFDAEGAEINEYEGDEQEIILDVVGGDLAILIGRRGHSCRCHPNACFQYNQPQAWI